MTQADLERAYTELTAQPHPRATETDYRAWLSSFTNDKGETLTPEIIDERELVLCQE